MKSGIFCFLFFLILNYAQTADAQFFVNGESPASVKWMQIKTPEFQVIYPEGIQKEAELLILNLEKTAALSQKPYHLPAKRLPILLNMTSVRSNGFVTWTPRRMELIVTPPQDSYAQDWIGQLALHEYRHVVQLSQLDQGFLYGLKYLTGELATGGGSAILPAWFYEGDAVLNETNLSAAGRGRLAGFIMPLRTLLMGDKKLYSYSKSLLGSYKDFVPDHYQYGFQMVSWSNEHYGKDFWPEAIDFSARNAYTLSPLALHLILKHKTGKKIIYKSTMDSVKQLYNRQETYITYSEYSIVNQRKSGNYTNYRFPYLLKDGKILAIKSGISQRDFFVVIDSAGNENKILTPGTMSGLKTDENNNRILWDEIISDPRWSQRSFSDIRIFDLSEGKLHNLTKRTRYFCPDFSPDGKTIAVSETDLQDVHYLTLISSKDGKPVRRLPSPGNREVTFPEWVSDSEVVVITISARGKQIERVDLANEQWTVILPYTRFDISQPVHYKNYILFKSAFTAVNNIFAIDTGSSRLFQVTFSRFGASDPSVSRDSSFLLFSLYSDRGFDFTKIKIDPSLWKPVPVSAEPTGIWPEEEKSDYPGTFMADSVNKPFHEDVPYSKLGHLFHIHSWLPFYIPVADLPRSDRTLPVELGAMMFSQNLLSTFISSIGYHYINGYHYVAPKITWRGWYPVFELSGQIGGPPQSYPFPEGVIPGGMNTYFDLHLKMYVPLYFDRGKYITYIVPQLDYERNSAHYYSNNTEHYGLNYFHGILYATRFLRMSRRDLYPRLGGYVYAYYTNTPWDEGLLGSQFAVQGGIYLPGIGPHHHLLLKGAWQKQYPGTYYLSLNRIDFPRGYPASISAEIKTFSADYALPLVYPDWSTEPIIYIKRIRADLFYDWSHGTDVYQGNDVWYTGTYQSAGVELMVDFHAGRILFPFSAGVRVGYLFNSDSIFTEFLFRIHL